MVGRNSSRVVVAFFLVFLLAPGLSAFVAPSTAEIENRRLSSFPELSIDSLRDRSFFEGVVRYASDHMSVRTLAIRLSAGLHYHLLGQSPNPEEVVVGEDGWLYLRETFDDGCGSQRHDMPDLLDLVTTLEARGKTVVYTVAPDKMSIYPEPLTPEGEALAACSIESGRLLEAALAEVVRSGYIDLWDVFRDAPEDELVYFQTDSHFNYAGNRLFVDRIVDLVAPGVRLDWSSGSSSHYGNLMRSAGLGATERVADWSFAAPPPRLVEQTDTRFSDDYYATEVYESADPVIGGSMLILKDSFMDLGMAQFASLWSRTTFTDFRSPGSIERFFEEIDHHESILIMTAEHAALERFGGDNQTLSPLIARLAED
jgi:hypothetical protein